MTDRSRVLPAPALSEENRTYFEAAGEGRLVTRRCRACTRLHFYPRAICPHCGSSDTGWEHLAGRGVVYTVSATHRAGPVPYAIAYVTLDEGVTMLTNVVGCDPADVKIGQRVRAVFEKAEDGTKIPMFVPE